jgi:hypothetical protein
MASNQSLIHEAVRARSSTAADYNSDWLAMMAIDGFETGPFTSRQHEWLNAELADSGDTNAPYSSIVAAQSAYARQQGFRTWSDMNTLGDYEADTLAYIAEMSEAPDATRSHLINTYVLTLKDAGIWPLMDIIYLVAAHDDNASRINLKTPGSFAMANVSTGPTFEADAGQTGNGSSTALSTQWTPSTQAVRFTQNDASMWVWCTTDVAENAADCGAAVTHNSFIRARSAGDAISVSINSGTTTTVSIGTSIGLTGVSRNGASIQDVWKNGVQVGAGAGASTGLPAGAVRICGRATDLFSSKQIAFFAAGASLNATQALDFYNATLAYLEGVGAA